MEGDWQRPSSQVFSNPVKESKKKTDFSVHCWKKSGVSKLPYCSGSRILILSKCSGSTVCMLNYVPHRVRAEDKRKSLFLSYKTHFPTESARVRRIIIVEFRVPTRRKICRNWSFFFFASSLFIYRPPFSHCLPLPFLPLRSLILASSLSFHNTQNVTNLAKCKLYWNNEMIFFFRPWFFNIDFITYNYLPLIYRQPFFLSFFFSVREIIHKPFDGFFKNVHPANANLKKYFSFLFFEIICWPGNRKQFASNE